MNYKTSDFYFAATLRALGFEIVEVTRDKGRSTFHFGNIEYVDVIRDDYFNGKCSGDYKTFVEAIKELKTRIYDSNT